MLRLLARTYSSIFNSSPGILNPSIFIVKDENNLTLEEQNKIKHELSLVFNSKDSLYLLKLFNETSKLKSDPIKKLILLSAQKHISSMTWKDTHQVLKQFSMDFRYQKENKMLFDILQKIPSKISHFGVLNYFSHYIHRFKLSKDNLNIEECLQGVSLNSMNIIAFTLVASNIQSENLMRKALKFAEIAEPELEKLINLAKILKPKDIPLLRKLVLKRIAEFPSLDIESINRATFLILSDYAYHEVFHKFLDSHITTITEQANETQILNIFNSLGLRYWEVNIKTVKKVNENLKTRQFTNDTKNIATLFHNLRKFSMEVAPFLKLITTDVIERSIPIEVSIIFHSTYRYLDESRLMLLKKKILDVMDELNPKHILNVAKDLVESRINYDREYIEAFEKKAVKNLMNHQSPDNITFKTQIMSFYYLKYKRDNMIESSEGEED